METSDDTNKPAATIETTTVDVIEAAPLTKKNQSTSEKKTEPPSVLDDDDAVKTKSDPGKVSSEVAILAIDEAPTSVSFSPTSMDEKKQDHDIVEVLDDEEEEEPTTSLEEVYEALDGLRSPGSTCTGGVTTDLPPIPGLVVEGVGEISLPLSPESTERLKQVANQAPMDVGWKP